MLCIVCNLQLQWSSEKIHYSFEIEIITESNNSKQCAKYQRDWTAAFQMFFMSRTIGVITTNNQVGIVQYAEIALADKG